MNRKRKPTLEKVLAHSAASATNRVEIIVIPDDFEKAMTEWKTGTVYPLNITLRLAPTKSNLRKYRQRRKK